MEATITIEQFGIILQSEDDNLLLQLIRQLQSKINLDQSHYRPPVEGPTMAWTGWSC